MTNAKISQYFMWLFASIMLSTASVVKAQNLKIVPQSSNMVIFGTSNLHNWEIKIPQINGELGINNSKQLNTLMLKIPVRSLKSGNGIMDGKTYTALKEKKFPIIVFQLTEASPVKISDKTVEAILTGNLSLAGETKKISIKCTGKATGAEHYQFSGSIPLKMTDFKISPPTAMFGTLKTGDAVTIKYNITLEGTL